MIPVVLIAGLSLFALGSTHGRRLLTQAHPAPPTIIQIGVFY